MFPNPLNEVNQVSWRVGLPKTLQADNRFILQAVNRFTLQAVNSYNSYKRLTGEQCQYTNYGFKEGHKCLPDIEVDQFIHIRL